MASSLQKPMKVNDANSDLGFHGSSSTNIVDAHVEEAVAAHLARMHDLKCSRVMRSMLLIGNMDKF